MPTVDASTPFEKALSAFRDRIVADSSIDETVKVAVLADLGSANPAAFEQLATVLHRRGQADEAEEPQRT